MDRSIDNAELLAILLSTTTDRLELAGGGSIDWSAHYSDGTTGFEVADVDGALVALTRTEMLELVRGLARGGRGTLPAATGDVEWSDGLLQVTDGADTVSVEITADEVQTLVQRLAASLIG